MEIGNSRTIVYGYDLFVDIGGVRMGWGWEIWGRRK